MPRLSVSIKQSSASAVDIVPPGSREEQLAWLERLERVFGTCGQPFAFSMVNRILTACRDKDCKVDEARANAMLAVVEGANPKNQLEAMVAMQFALKSMAGMTLLQRCMDADRVPQFESASNSAGKLMRTAAALVETLAKLQRNGQQTVQVVHLHDNAQAVTGNVAAGASGVAT